MAKTVHYYVISEVRITVIDSQVFGWLELLNKNGYPSNCISIVGWKSFVKRKTDEEAISRKIGGRFIHIPIIQKKLLSDFQLFIIFLFIWLKEVFTAKKIIFQTRISSVSFALSFVRVLPKVRVIYDSRAATLEEFYYNYGNQKLSLLKWIGHLISVSHEKKMLKIADKVFCVSEKLKSYHLSKNQGLQKDKFIVIPGAADSNLFFYNKASRDNVREKLKIDDKIVLVYSGRLDKKWQIPWKIFQLYKYLEDRITNVTLLLVTPDIDIAKSLKQLNNFSNDQIIIYKSKYENVCDYLNAADFALLLRDNVPMNNVASPTKFAEYIMCGLPVIISEGIGDFSEFVMENNIGLIVNNNLDSIVTEFKDNFYNSFFDRNRIANIGKENFSKQKYLSDIIDVYRSLSI